MNANDADLVAQSLAGDRDAFGQIVARYQSLVCALANSATGSLSQSEDLAQDTFLAAWQQLPRLREPGKVRAWLCRIARNRIADAVHTQRRDPAHAAIPLEQVHDSPGSDALPAEQTIGREEEAILWRSLEQIPSIYRDPLVLFYREHHSIEEVAGALELSEDAVKQRLSRGRKLLHEQVLTFVESTLERTNPGRQFTLGLLAALPVLVNTTKAAAGPTEVISGLAAKILFMTKTTQIIIVAAVVTTALVVTPIVWHHLRTPAVSDEGPRVTGALTPPQAAEAQQTARDFLEAVGKGDWNIVADLWPPGGKGVDDVFTDQVKAKFEGMKIVNLGDPFTKPGYPGVFVPYEIRFRNGKVKKWNLAVRQDNPERRWYWDGGL